MKLKVRVIKNSLILLFILITTISFLKIVTSENSKIVVLNKQEYPKLHANWSVNFITYGNYDLIIEGIKGKYTEINDDGNLELLQLKCGKKILFDKEKNIHNINMDFMDNKVIFYDYSCPEISTWTVRLLECNKHKQRFIFGDSEDYADNACEGTDTFVLKIYDPSSAEIQTCGAQDISPTGGTYCDNTDVDSCSDGVICQKVGTYTAEITCAGCSVHAPVGSQTIFTCYAPETNKFVIKNSSGKNIAAFDEKGYLYLKGKNETNTGALSPPTGSFIIKNSAGTVMAYIDSSGAFYHKGSVQEYQASLSPPAGSFIIKNSTNKYVSYIDKNGNIVLTGGLYEKWLETI